MAKQSRKEKRKNERKAFDFAAWKKKILADPAPRALIEDFLKDRHRDWELRLEAELASSPKARHDRIERPASRSRSRLGDR